MKNKLTAISLAWILAITSPTQDATSAFASGIWDIIQLWAGFSRAMWHTWVKRMTPEVLPEWCTFYYEPINDNFSKRVYVGENCPKELQE